MIFMFDLFHINSLSRLISCSLSWWDKLDLFQLIHFRIHAPSPVTKIYIVINHTDRIRDIQTADMWSFMGMHEAFSGCWRINSSGKPLSLTAKHEIMWPFCCNSPPVDLLGKLRNQIESSSPSVII